jgi:hypothetical protein
LIRTGVRAPVTAGEALVLAVVAVAVLNYTPSLFTEEHVSDDTVWIKGLKDLPVLALAVYLASTLVRRPGELRLDPPVRVLLGAVIGMAALMLLSAAFVESPDTGFLVAGRYYVLYPLLGIGLWLYGWEDEQRRRVALLIVGLGLVQVALAALEFAGLFTTYFAKSAEVAGHQFPRAIGTLGGPINLSIFLGLAAILAATGAAPMRERGVRASLAALAAGLLLTLTKGTALVFAIVGWVLARVRGWVPAAAAWLAAGLASVVVAASLRYERGFGERTQEAGDAFDIWTEDAGSFLVGKGFGYISSLESGELEVLPADGMLQGVGIEGGLVAVLVMALIVGAALVSLWRLRNRDAFCLAVLLFGGLLTAYAPFELSFRAVPAALLFWVLFGLRSPPAPSTAR